MTEERKGEAFILTGALFWSFFPIVTVISLSTLKPLVSLGWSSLLAAVFFGVIIAVRGKWKEVTNRTALKYIVGIVILLGVCFYGLYFWGLKYTNPGNASLIAQTEIFFTFLFFNVWRKKYISAKHIWGALLMIGGAVIVLLPNFHTFNPGDMLIVAAMAFAPLGNHFQQKAREEVSSETMMFVRSALATPVVFLLARLLGETVSLADLKSSWVAVAINGFVLFGASKILWIEGIHRISVTKAIAMSGLGPLLTLLFSWLILGYAPTLFQMSALLPMFFGLLFLTSRKDAVPQ